MCFYTDKSNLLTVKNGFQIFQHDRKGDMLFGLKNLFKPFTELAFLSTVVSSLFSINCKSKAGDERYVWRRTFYEVELMMAIRK